MKRAFMLGALVVAVAASVFVARADAILFGTPDGNDHKGVGYIVFYDAANVPLWRCTGSLVSRRVLLTAGHCAGTYDNSTGFHTPASAQVWFDKQIKTGKYPADGPTQDPPVPCTGFKGYPCSGGDSIGKPVSAPGYVGSTADGTSHDLGVVMLARQMNGHDVLDLAPVGTLVHTPANSPMTIVGYGLQNQPPPVVDRQRMRGTVSFYRVEDGTQPDDEFAFADFSNSAPGAAACYGDSGGPVLNGDGEIVAVIALLDPNVDGFCAGDAYHYRTDTVEAKQFLERAGVTVPGSGSDPGSGHHRKHGHGFNDD